MRGVVDERQIRHAPECFMANGVRLPNPEQPERVSILREGAERAGLAFTAPKDFGMAPIAAIHSEAYLRFLANIYTRWQRIDGAGKEVIPNIHPDRRGANYPKSAAGQAGFHQADTACPIAAHTWEAAYWSAQTALSAAEIARDEGQAYALCRPPGHHAFADLAGGFCFLNNSAIAADWLTRQGHRVAILDVDVHHGNGTQGIFYDRADVLTVSIHADPDRFYPFFWGGAQERGTGPGRGMNLNLPMPRKTDDESWQAALERALEAIGLFGADAVVVALGLDAHENDPFQGFRLTTPFFAQMGQRLAGVAPVVLHVQEGGYVHPELGGILQSYLSGAQS